MNVVEVHHVGLEFVEHGFETGSHVAPAQRAVHGPQLVSHATAKTHLAGEQRLIPGFHVLGVLHGKYLCLKAVVTQQGLGVDDDDAVTAPRVVKLVDQEYSFRHDSADGFAVTR